jgi:hypothetical protein
MIPINMDLLYIIALNNTFANIHSLHSATITPMLGTALRRGYPNPGG